MKIIIYNDDIGIHGGREANYVKTNGDVIKAMFPNFHIDEMSHTVWVGYDNMSFRREWWEAPYETESEEK